MPDARQTIEGVIEDGDGVIRVEPAWVCRKFLPHGERLGRENYEPDDGDVEGRGFVSERWLASTTKADNEVGPPDEGLSYIQTGTDEPLLLKDAVMQAPDLIVGEEYAANHAEMLATGSLGRLAKIYDFAVRIPFHLHQMKEDTDELSKERGFPVGPKREAYYFPPDVPMGKDPSTYFGINLSLFENGLDEVKAFFADYLQNWVDGSIASYEDDWILKASIEQMLKAEVGYLLPSGGLHAPGTALTIELQEDSDVFAMYQAFLSNNSPVPIGTLWKDVPKKDVEAENVWAAVKQVDWELSTDPEYTDKFRLVPTLRPETQQDGGMEQWIHYGSRNEAFTGLKVTVNPGQTFTSRDAGVYNALTWKGEGTINGLEVIGTGTEINPRKHMYDEVVVTHKAAVRGVPITNTGTTPLTIIKFFGPDINKGDHMPLVEAYR